MSSARDDVTTMHVVCLYTFAGRGGDLLNMNIALHCNRSRQGGEQAGSILRLSFDVDCLYHKPR